MIWICGSPATSARGRLYQQCGLIFLSFDLLLAHSKTAHKPYRQIKKTLSANKADRVVRRDADGLRPSLASNDGKVGPKGS